MMDENQTTSTNVESSRPPTVEEFFVDSHDEMVNDNLENNDVEVDVDDMMPLPGSTQVTQPEGVDSDHDVSEPPFKRATTSQVWHDLSKPEKVGDKWRTKCNYCPTYLSVLPSKSTTHLKRHLEKCRGRASHLRKQSRINFMPSDSSTGTSKKSEFVSALHNGKLDMMCMREGLAHWLLMHEHPFSLVEEDGFNMFMKRGIPQWKSVSRHTTRNDCFKAYESEKNKLKLLLKDVDRISLTTDLWRSRAQKVEYMVLTAHFIDCDWNLQKRVLNFVRIPAPRKGRNIADCIFSSLREWDIESKVYTLSVDNASANDSCISIMKDTFSRTKRLVCDGKLFHVRCCAHILNIMVQHGLKMVKLIIKNVHDSVDYLNDSEYRMQSFVKIVQQFNLPERKLILDCKTRWNSTYEMLACAIKFKEVFNVLAKEDKDYIFCPSADDWEKIEKLLEILKVFYDTTNIISGSEYPTSNLFLSEVYRIKLLLDNRSESSDDFVRKLVKNMKERFDKYWGECNMLMAIGAVLDPRLKMKVIEITFPKMFPFHDARDNINKVKETLRELYDEYVSIYSPTNVERSPYHGTGRHVSGGGNTIGLSELLREVQNDEIAEPKKSELDNYLEEGCFMPVGDSFDALGWWKDRSMKFRVLARLAADILAVPITTVASESTFSAGSRVIEPYRAKLTPEAVQVIICTGDWCRSLHGVKRKRKDKNVDDEPTEINLPIP